MKFKVAVIAILMTILGVTTTGVVLLVQEAREQTEIALRTTEIVALQADLEAYTTILDRNGDHLDLDYFVAYQAEDSINRMQEIFEELKIEGKFGYGINHSFGYQEIVKGLGSK